MKKLQQGEEGRLIRHTESILKYKLQAQKSRYKTGLK